MKSFKQFLLAEVGGAPHPFVKMDAGGLGGFYRFTHDGKDYHVDIHHYGGAPHEAEVSFVDDSSNVYKSGAAGYTAAKILSTVHNIITHYIKSRPAVKKVIFSSDNDEPSRTKLYTRYTASLGGVSRPDTYETHHEIPADAYRKPLVRESEDRPVLLKLGQKPNEENVNKFLDDYHSDSQEHPFHRSARILHGAVVDLSKDGNEIHVHDILTLAPKSGAGTKALKHLTNLADKHNVKLNIFAKAYSKQPEHITSTPRLVKWYEKHGFKHDEPDYDESWGAEMRYYPKTR